MVGGMNMLDAGGTMFAPSDTFRLGTQNGNGGQYFVGGGATSGPTFACDTAALTAAGMGTSAAISAAIQATTWDYCTASPNIDVLSPWTTGRAEQERILAGDQTILAGNNDDGDEPRMPVGMLRTSIQLNLDSTSKKLTAGCRTSQKILGQR